MKVVVIFAEFNRAKPDTSNVRRYFPEADIQIYGKNDCEDIFEPGPRWGYRMNDYWKVRKCLDSDADVAIALDSDMRIVSDDVKVLPQLAAAFGVCLPANPRKLVRIDTKIGADSDGQLDESHGTGFAYNCGVIAINCTKLHAMGYECARVFCEIMEEKPVRGPLAWWRAAWDTGFAPFLLPPQWCVCAEDVGIGNEIILHEGHDAVRRYYQKAS